MAYPSRPRHTAGDQDDAMQRYMLLSSQQEVMRRRLSLQLPSSAPMTAQSPEFQSLTSPTSSRASFTPSWSPEPSYTSPQPMSAYPIPTQPGVAHRHRYTIDSLPSEDSREACKVNQQIKATLTELLNTESVRSDEKYRAWIQERLMDAEHNIRKQRRRRSSIDREIADNIAGSL
ncbi:hypothetical protein BDV96DRAFT_599640 [Lophiotrema nucula]|uniref:Uncharacterized protein n=1 Tax=Lophiotrema nucula TaxID=690887 RepID=A0A6A5Z710_9PLEO|nr:hypothetical protein BDV96DRAFT_599640 [Lophiotrema nucula]